MQVETKQGLPVLAFESRRSWEAWLDGQHGDTGGIWLKFAKKGSGVESVTYTEAVEGALCYGWIDGQAASYDDRFYLQRFTPRRARSKWSKVNRERAGRLIAAGRMKPAGLAEIERARADGRWEAAYDSPSTATVPDDLREKLDENPEAAVFFDSINKSSRYSILYQIQDAKRPETRARRIERFVAMLNRGEKPL